MKTGEEVTALIVIDVQQGFDDSAYWGARNNPACEDNVVRLLETWRQNEWPVVFVKHNSTTPDSPLSNNSPGNDFKAILDGHRDVVIEKQVHSAFYGDPDLKQWLDSHGITRVAISGIQTNMCCETTARMASDLGYTLMFVEDATHTFDVTDGSGTVFTADNISRYTSATIAADFGRVVTTSDLIYDEFLQA